MNNKQKEVLQHHRHFLLQNVVWSDDLAAKLLTEGIITEHTLKEIQSSDGGKHAYRKKMAKVLDALPLRGEAVFSKFIDLLHVNGHPFIADLLRDDEAGESSEVAGVREVYKRVPALEKTLKDSEKRAIELFIIEKAKETSLKASWSKDAVAREKHKAIKAMEKQLEDAFEYEVKERKKNEEIENLKAELKDEKQHVVELRSELGFVKSELQTTETKMRNDFGVQMKFSMANENALRKLTDKYELCNKLLTSIENKIKSTLETPARNSERDQMAITEFQFAFLLSDLDTLLTKYSRLLDIQKQYETLLHERNYILAHLGVHESDDNKPSLLTAYRDFAVRADEDMTDLKQKLEKHTDVIEGQKNKIDDLNKEVEKQSQVTKLKTAGTAWQNALLNVMRKQLNDVKQENRKKDTKLKVFEGEISKLKARLAELESRRDSHHGHLHVHTHVHEPVRSRASSHEDRDTSTISTNENHKRKNVHLPPLGGKVMYQAVDFPATHDYSPKRAKPQKPPRHMWDPRQNVMNPDSLITAQLKLESKSMPTPAHVGGKYGQLMPHRLGEMRHSPNKPSIYK